jgi:hypothetical protein
MAEEMQKIGQLSFLKLFHEDFSYIVSKQSLP